LIKVISSFLLVIKLFINVAWQRLHQKQDDFIVEDTVEIKLRKKRQPFEIPEGHNFVIKKVYNEKEITNLSVPPPTGGLWTDDDIDTLIKLVKKYPGGTLKRWDIIAAQMNRSVAEVTYMANKLKKHLFNTEREEAEVMPEKVKQKN